MVRRAVLVETYLEAQPGECGVVKTSWEGRTRELLATLAPGVLMDAYVLQHGSAGGKPTGAAKI